MNDRWDGDGDEEKDQENICDSNENSWKNIVPDDFHFVEKEIDS